MLRKALAGALGLALMSGTAFAATQVSSTDYGLAAPAGTVLVDFNGGNLNGFTLTGNYAFVNSSVSGQYAAPADSPTTQTTTDYLVVPGQGVDGYADLWSATGYQSVSFLWGSIDNYNDVQLLDAAGNVFGTLFNGDDPNIADPNADGGQFGAATNRRVFFTQQAGDPLIYGIRFSNHGARAFEIENVAFGAVPEPTTWAMLIAGFGLVGGAMRRRRTSTTMVTA
ncbi:PEPxxWA-CTERM sorting domain-containing protein [Sphingomonas sp. SCN 67-18]|uniref:PEPxxWA-CTERM sorting domain-containing protein n=1 Tax=uncultured Sphingomonas sp. TaxID=158754 RepID=UPI000AF8FBF5|nr:PEPxxWA-CTERM sorting domain-containing protein [Sphingomonas sp. SCN 67-18]